MIQQKTILVPADNSGAKALIVIHVFGGSRRKFGSLGSVVNAVVMSAIPTSQVKDGEIVKAVIVRTRKEVKRADGSYVRFSDNAAVVIDNAKDKNVKGTRIFGPVAREVQKEFPKIASMAVEVV